jgi:hypothetical protein
MVKPGFALIGSALALLASSSCSEDPTLSNALNTKFTEVDITVVEDTLDAVSGSSFRQFVPMNGLRNMVGKIGELDALLAMQFIQLPLRDTVEVVSATVRLRAVTWSGEMTGTLKFNAYKITRPWSPLTLIWDTVASAGFYESGIVRGSYTGTVAADTEFVSFALDTALVDDWLETTQYGILLVPDDDPGSVLARGFTGFGTDSVQNLPTLTIIARNLAGTVTDTAEYTIGNDTFVGNIDDLASNSERLYVQSGVVYRSLLSFDASDIPPGAIVNEADMILWIDRTASNTGKFSADTLMASHVLTSATDSTRFETVGSVAQNGPAESVLFDVRHAAQLWVNGTNYGILLRASSLNEFSSLDRFVLHGPASSAVNLRPRVRVLYSIEREIR